MSLFGNSGDVTGYNCQQINELRTVINDIAQKSGTNIVERLHNDIITPMSTVWYAPEAKTFFEGLAATVQASGEAITNAFDTFRGAVQTAGENWADNTGGERPSLASIDKIDLNLNVTDIQESNAGNVTIDGAQATAIASRLTEVEEGIKSDLQGLAGQLNAESAFIGRGQAEALQQCFVTVSGEIHKIFKYLTEGEDSLQGQINKAVQKYQDVSSNISSAFTNIN
ncbi:MAG TPA: hypothetical protein DCY94_02950 [Firmicutes bacterium]|nr:hypothetical protein [Bacillota bacterium]